MPLAMFMLSNQQRRNNILLKCPRAWSFNKNYARRNSWKAKFHGIKFGQKSFNSSTRTIAEKNTNQKASPPQNYERFSITIVKTNKLVITELGNFYSFIWHWGQILNWTLFYHYFVSVVCYLFLGFKGLKEEKNSNPATLGPKLYKIVREINNYN